LTESGCEFNLSLEIGLAHGGLNSCYSLIEVFSCYVGRSQFRGLHLEEGHVDATGVAGVGRLVEAIGGHAELGCSLASSNRHHHRLFHDDGDIRAGITLSRITQIFIIMILKIVWCLAQSDLKLDNASNWVRQGDVDTLFETTSDGGVELPRNV